MPITKRANSPFGELFQKLQTRHDTREHIQDSVQLAVQIEFMTIPAYLTALYSIQDVSSTAYQLLRSVVMEEMYHANQAANLLVAVGGYPKFTGSAVPTYPNYLPQANPDTTPYIGLTRASTDVFADVFAAIEEPAAFDSPPQGTQYDTIAQVYKAIEQAMENYSGTTPLFEQANGTWQRTNIYPGKFGGKPIAIHNLKEAKMGINEIVSQGEGAVPESGAYVPVEPYGTYNHYGQRADGTYGPILGTPYEMSHFKKFRTIALDIANFPATYPIISNPKPSDFRESPLLVIANQTFNFAYSIMLDALQNSFLIPKNDKVPDQFYGIALPIMHQVMPALARLMMNTPTRQDGNAGTGPNGSPTFQYLPDCQLGKLAEKIERVLKLAIPAANENNSLGTVLSALQEAVNVIKASAKA